MINIALVIISDKDNKILLQHRDNNAPTNPNKWGLWGGRIEGEETPAQAAVRELNEELCISVKEEDLSLLHVYKDRHFNDDWTGHIFHLEDKGGFVYNLQEGDGLGFYSEDEIKSLDLDSIARPIIENYFKK